MNDNSKQKFEEKSENFEKQLLVNQYVSHAKDWFKIYGKLIQDLIDNFGEEEVLDLVEKKWWDQARQAGLEWRERFEKDPERALHEKAESWHDDPLWARICCCDVDIGDQRWELRSVKCFREVFNEMNMPKIGISLCMGDFAAVKGWHPRVVMRQPTNMLRGDNYCHQIRYITDDPEEQWDYSKEISRKVGWRSIKKLEEE